MSGLAGGRRRIPQHRIINLSNRAAAGEGHSALKFVAENLYDALDTARARYRQTINIRTADKDCFDAERQSRQHVSSATDAAIEQYRDSPSSGFSDVGKRVNGRGQKIEVAAAVIGNDDAVHTIVDGAAGVLR